MPPRIAFVASQTEEAQAIRAVLAQRHGDAPLEEAEVIVALGGDGFMLRTLHRHRAHALPVYGMKLGSIGFLMNQYGEADLEQRLARAQPTVLRPLMMEAVTEAGNSVTSLAFNEVSLLRQTKQAAHVKVSLNGVAKLDELVCDGVLVSTTAGSTAYNLSAHGPILPLGSQLLALTPISPFRPRRWRGVSSKPRASARRPSSKSWSKQPPRCSRLATTGKPQSWSDARAGTRASLGSLRVGLPSCTRFP